MKSVRTDQLEEREEIREKIISELWSVWVRVCSFSCLSVRLFVPTSWYQIGRSSGQSEVDEDGHIYVYI